MKKIFVFVSALFIFLAYGNAQNTSPYWSLVGNNNATAASKLGTTNDISLRFYTNNVQRMIINSAAGNVGIGIVSPVNILTVQSSGSIPAASWLNGLNTPVFVGFGETVSSEFLLAGASNTAINRAVFQGRRARGTLAAPAAVVNNDYITSLLASAYDGGTFQNPALVSFFVDGVPSAGHVPARISFVTGTNGGDRVERLKVGSTGNFTFNTNQIYLRASDGNVGIGTISPTNKLHVVGTSLFTANLNVTAGGISAANTGGYGVFGSSDYLGVYGYAPSGNWGVYGYGSTGVYGTSSNSAFGVYGSSSSSYNTNGSAGVYGTAYYGVHGVGTFGVWGEGTSYGTYGSSIDGYGATAISTNSYGLYASNSTGSWGAVAYGGYGGSFGSGDTYGVYGSGTTQGVYASGTTYGSYSVGNIGAYGFTSVSGGDAVHARATNSAGYGVYAESTQSFGIYASTGNGSSYAGYFSGNTYCTGSYLGSDKKLKTNIKEFNSAMEIINKLKPREYEFRHDGTYEKMNLPTGNHYGLIAQDVETVLPQIVKETEFNAGRSVVEQPNVAISAENAAKKLAPAKPTELAKPTPATKDEIVNFKAVNYIELIPIMIKAMQETNAANQEKDRQIADLQNQINELKSMILSGNNNSLITPLSGYLKQNVPNPASNTTVINYYLPDNIMHTQIKVTDMKGSVLKVYSAPGGAGQVNIRNGELPAGVYNYTLYANNKKLDTKQMVIMK